MNQLLTPSLAGKVSDAGLYAPSPEYLKGEEQLRVTSFGNSSGITLQIAARVLSPDGELHPYIVLHTPNSNRTAARTTVPLSEGWLLGVSVSVSSGTPLSNGVWVLVELTRGSGTREVALQTLGSDFVSPGGPMWWPSGGFVEPLDGAGCLRTIAGTTPAAGAEISETVPANTRWELLSIAFGLTTAVAAANRIVKLQLDDGTNGDFADCPNITQTASLLNVYSFAQGQSKLAAPNTAAIMGNVPIGNRLKAGDRIRTSTTAIQAADQYSQPFYRVREWLDV